MLAILKQAHNLLNLFSKWSGNFGFEAQSSWYRLENCKGTEVCHSAAVTFQHMQNVLSDRDVSSDLPAKKARRKLSERKTLASRDRDAKRCKPGSTQTDQFREQKKGNVE